LAIAIELSIYNYLQRGTEMNRSVIRGAAATVVQLRCVVWLKKVSRWWSKAWRTRVHVADIWWQVNDSRRRV